MTDAHSPGAMPVSALLADDISRVEPSATLIEVTEALTADEVGVLVVGDGDRPVGVISERDVVAAIAAGRALDGTTAAEVASTELVWCDAAATVAEVAEEMAERYVRHVLVEDGGHLVGVVSARDLLGVYAAAEVDFES